MEARIIHEALGFPKTQEGPLVGLGASRVLWTSFSRRKPASQ